MICLEVLQAFEVIAALGCWHDHGIIGTIVGFVVTIFTLLPKSEA